MYGWRGKGLLVDLTSGEIKHDQVDEDTLRMFLGGRGLGVKLYCDKIGPGVDPLSPQNGLIFATGPLTGTRTPAAGRHAVVSKSPLTGTIFDGNAGGFWGTALKKAGYDYIFLKGRALHPVFLLVDGEEVSLQNADLLWGRNTTETFVLLKAVLSKGMKNRTAIACIGRAGERSVPFASIMSDRGSTCGRGGLGAVMGSKNLKALVVRGDKTVPVADKNHFIRARQDILRLLTASPVASKGLSAFGTPVLVNLINYMRLLPTDNFRRVHFEQAYEISGEKIKDSFNRQKRPCYGCPIACKFGTEAMEIPEYETLSLLGSSCCNSSLNSILRLNALCNDYGLDTITTGGTLACYSEIMERRLSPQEMEELVKEIGDRQGTGAELALGSAVFASARNKPASAMHVKRLELPGYDPRGALGMALGYATSNRGGCHLRAYMIGPEIFGKPKLIDRFAFQDKAGLLPVFQNFFAALDSLVVCKFVSFSVGEEEMAAVLAAVTGIPFSTEELLKAGERIWNLERLFNIKEGFSCEDDNLPQRFFQDSEDGYAKGIDRGAFWEAKQNYYRFRGWTGRGIPTREKLAGLGLIK